MIEIKNYIGGECVPPTTGKYLDNHSPATGEVYSLVPDSDVADVQRAVEAAQRAFPHWAKTPASDRAKYLRKIATAITTHQDELAKAESIDTGKPLSMALNVDIARSAQNFEFFADAATQFSTECHVTDQLALNYTVRDPLGVVACISPWNLPLYLLTWKIAPALAMGNTVIAKPSEITPMTADLLSQICIEVGLPPGVLNIVHGLGAKVGNSLSHHPEIRAISFTGSTKTGSEIARIAAPAFKKLSLEMGGKNPNLIFEDVNLEEALTGTVRAAFSNQGQICLCGSRIFIQNKIYSQFKEELIKRVSALKIGDPLDPETEQGALTSQVHFEKVMSYLEIARQEGGKFLTGGHRFQVKGRCEKGWFIAPTLIEGLSYDCRTNQEEIFGPVATLTPFETEAEVIAWANSTQYGLSASIWTNDLRRAHRVSAQLRAGMVWVNCWMLRDLRTPFGGVKDSGVGREGGVEALRFFTEPKNICIQN